MPIPLSHTNANSDAKREGERIEHHMPLTKLNRFIG